MFWRFGEGLQGQQAGTVWLEPWPSWASVGASGRLGGTADGPQGRLP